MVACSKCVEKAVLVSEEPLCKSHFIDSFEQKVLSTVEQFNLVRKGERIIVGSSGGKDSTATLYILNKYFGKVEALAVDEGIAGYRSITLQDLERFCDAQGIPLHISSYKEEFGFSLTEALQVRADVSPCSMCGVLRRYLLNAKSRGFDKVATGHNLDDEAQSILMNLVKAQLPLLSRLGPMTGNVADSKFVPRIKPLYFCAEKEVATYAFVTGLAPRFIECPHAHRSFRASIRNMLNEYELRHRGAKRRLVSSFLQMLPCLKAHQTGLSLSLSYCRQCGEPSSKGLCRACLVVSSIHAKLLPNKTLK